MSRLSTSIPKQPEQKPAEDFYRLRREGIGFIEEMGSHLWTDYNSHDPGITILEALCYAITDLAYRIDWDIKDILAPAAPDQKEPFPNQPFFTAREILTVNPLTPDDFRRLLIDLDTVRNAWVVCKQCACETGYYAWYDNDQLKLAYQPSEDSSLGFEKVTPHGLYDVLLELEADPELGDLNDRKIEHHSVLAEDFKMELRFPELSFEYWEEWKLFEDNDIPYKVTLSKFSETGNSRNLLQDKDVENKNIYLKYQKDNVFSVDFQIMFSFSEIPDTVICIDNATLRLFGESYVKNRVTLDEIQNELEVGNVINNYGRKLRESEKAVVDAKSTLHQHRNLDEDYCCVRIVDVEDVAVCADVELTPDADIERVQARIWFEIEQYFNRPVRFYSLQELMDAEVPVEDIFNGPQLNNGFIKTEELEDADLKTVLRTSDIINRLMDIDGVVAINNLLLSHYDAAGNIIKGQIDPKRNAPDKSSAEWMLFVSPLHQPRLYHNQSRFLFFKNGLPFDPRMDEAQDTLTQLRGEFERPKISNTDDTENELSAPTGTFRDIDEYFPVQYSLPAAYGIGPEGLQAHASSSRQAKAKQLKAYLMAFEQILGNAFAQLAHTADLFSLDPGQTHTSFVYQFSEEIITGYDEIVTDLDLTELEDMTETRSEFLERRNRFLDHIMARFGEQFSEYALMLTNSGGKQLALEQLIEDKIHFLKEYPQISGKRAKAFNYTEIPCSADNSAMLKKRISLLLGSPEEISERAIIVEHLLLRPKFPGDALYPACSDGACTTCGDEDPYSFRLTFVMPGWTEPYNTDMAMREFAERTIRRETPSHLLAKICWVGNDGFVGIPDDAVINTMAALLETAGQTTSGERPEPEEACLCARKIYFACSEVFEQWYTDNTLHLFQPDALQTILAEEFTEISAENITCDIQLNNEVWAELMQIMIAYFQDIALHGWQFERFEDAWCTWLEANARFDWTKEHVQKEVESFLADNLRSGENNKAEKIDLSQCACTVVAQYGQEFHNWMAREINEGRGLENIIMGDDTIPPPTLCSQRFKDDTADELNKRLRKRYREYVEVSYRLQIVVNLLSELNSTYPTATLHDCDEGSDQNPIRLGKTVLGNI